LTIDSNSQHSQIKYIILLVESKISNHFIVFYLQNSTHPLFMITKKTPKDTSAVFFSSYHMVFFKYLRNKARQTIIRYDEVPINPYNKSYGIAHGKEEFRMFCILWLLWSPVVCP